MLPCRGWLERVRTQVLTYQKRLWYSDNFFDIPIIN